MNNQVPGQGGLMESALTASIAALFGIIAIYIPALFPLLFLLPVPFMVLITRQGIKYGVISLVVASILIGALTGVLSTLLILVIFAPTALAMGVLIRKKHNDFTVIGAGASINIFAIFATIQLLSVVAGFNFLDEMAVLLREAIQVQKEMLVSMDLQVNDVGELVNSFMMLFPGMVIVQAMLGSFMNYYLSLSILKRVGSKGLTLSEFSYFRLPGNIVLGSFIIFVLTYFTSYLDWINTDGLMSNVLLIFTFVFFTQGLAYISFLLKRMKVNKPIRIVILILFLVITPLLTVVSFLGLIDALFDMRRLKAKE